MSEQPRRRIWAARLVVILPYAWLAAFFLAPFLIVLKISLSQTALAQPPYLPVIDFAAGWQGVKDFFSALSPDNYRLLISDSLYFGSYLRSLTIAALSTLMLLLAGFPIAYALARMPRRWQPVLLVLVILPFWTSFLIRVYALIGILRPEGFLNQALLAAGMIAEPLVILNTNWAVLIGIVYSYLPFMVLPLYASLERFDPALLEAAADLGSPPRRRFWQITVPLARPGIVAGLMLVFIPAVGEFIIPDLLGGSGTLMIGKTLWNEFFNNRDWPVASAVAIVLLMILVVPIVLFQNAQARVREAAK